MSLHTGSLLHQPSAETLPDDLFAAGPARRSLVEHEKSGMMGAEQGRGDRSSLGRTQIPATGVDPASSHTRQIPVYWWNLGKSRPMCFHDASHRFTVVRSAGSRGREIAREELFISRAGLWLRAADSHTAHPHRLDPGGPGRAARGVPASGGPPGGRAGLSGPWTSSG